VLRTGSLTLTSRDYTFTIATSIMTDNWKETLFVWDGILSIVDKDESKDDSSSASATGGVAINWEGTWVGCVAADATQVETPKRGAFDEYVSSDHKFNVMGSAVQGSNDEKEEKNDSGTAIGGDASLLYVANMTDGIGYDLGDGSEKKNHKDTIHNMYLSTLRWKGNLRDQVENVVFAMGENEFGPFISVGWLRVGNRVTLARRYIDEDDERVKWEIDDLRKAVFDQNATVVEDGRVQITIPPWQCAAMHVNASHLSKRQKITKN
jgi:hypothetical protein